MKLLTSAVSILLLTTAALSAAPCATGTTTDNTGSKNASGSSSKVDGETTGKVTPGAKAESPGTVGALDNVGANTRPAPGEAQPAEGKVVKPGSNDC